MAATKIVILAAGRGSRMRRADDQVGLSDAQAAAAETGVKAMIPIQRPFLDYVLARVADAGGREVCLVVGPRHDEMRAYYAQLPTERLRIEFAVQRQPRGTADALAAAEPFVGDAPFLLLNSDNCYPTAALRALCEATSNAVVGFDRDGLIEDGALEAERILQFAIVQPDATGHLRRILEKPDPQEIRHLRPPILVSMNCWRFSPDIFEACRRIAPSPRGELEIPDAVTYSMEVLQQRYRIIPSREGVLDLSRRSDIGTVAQRLAGEQVWL